MPINQKLKKIMANICALAVLSTTGFAVPVMAQGENVLIFDEEVNGVYTFSSGSEVGTDKSVSGSKSIKIKGAVWGNTFTTEFDDVYDLSAYAENGTISFYLSNPSAKSGSFEINVYDVNGSRSSYWIETTESEWVRHDVSLNSPSFVSGSIDWSQIKSFGLASRPNDYSGWFWYVDFIHFTDDGTLPEIVPDDDGGDDGEDDGGDDSGDNGGNEGGDDGGNEDDDTPETEGAVYENNIWVFYDAPNGEGVGSNASVAGNNVVSGDKSIELKGNLWSANASYKIAFNEPYDFTRYLSDAKISIALNPEETAFDGSAFEIDIYDANENRLGFFINIDKKGEWTTHTVALSSPSVTTLADGQTEFDYSSVSNVTLASRPGSGSGTWYWYIDNFKFDLGLGDELLTINETTNAGEAGEIDENEDMVFVFSSELDEKTLKNISVSANSNAIAFEGSYSDGVYTISLKDKLAQYIDYEVDFTGVKSVSGLPISDEQTKLSFRKKAPLSVISDNTYMGVRTLEIKANEELIGAPVLVSVLYNLDYSIADITAAAFEITEGQTAEAGVVVPEVDGAHFCVVMALESLYSPKLIAKPFISGPKPAVDSQEPFTVKGKGEYKDTYASVVVLNKGCSFEDMKNPDTDLISDYIVNIAAVKTDENGNFVHQFSYPGQESEIGNKDTYFAVKTNIADKMTEEISPYFKAETVDNYIEGLTGKESQTEFSNAFNSSIDVFDLDKEIYNTLTDKSEVADILYNIGFEGKEDMNDSFVKASAVAALNQSSEMTVTELIKVIEPESTEINELYTKLSEKGKTAVNSSVKGQSFTDGETAYNKHIEQVSVNAITNYETDGYEQVRQVLEISGIDMSVYNSATNKGYIDSQLVKSNIKTLSDIESKIKELARTSSSNGGGGGGGGGSSSSSQPKYATTRPGFVAEGKSPEEQSPEVTGFKDMNGFVWAEEAVNYLAEKNIVNGVADGEFAPSMNVTREQFVLMLVRALKLEDENAQCDFTDIDSSHWAYKGVASALVSGITEGNTDGSFGLGKDITRQDIAVMVYRASKLEKAEEKSDFTDYESISDYAREAIDTLCANSIVSGMDDGTFAPLMSANRAQAAQIIYNLITRR